MRYRSNAAHSDAGTDTSKGRPVFVFGGKVESNFPVRQPHEMPLEVNVSEIGEPHWATGKQRYDKAIAKHHRVLRECFNCDRSFHKGYTQIVELVARYNTVPSAGALQAPLSRIERPPNVP